VLTDPTNLRLHDLDRATLSMLTRELMLAGHLEDRASIPVLLAAHGREEANEVAIEEWMTTSPVYTGRNRRALGIDGDGVDAILKSLQFEIGMPHQFLDAGFALHDETSGEFWLRRCGALADVRPMGHDFVRGMCVDIEDPTFDATAAATNRRARVRPIHRPPEVPKGGPDCHWTIRIDPGAPLLADHPHLAETASSRLASWPNDPPPSTEPGGWEDYRRPFDPGLELEDLSQRALVLMATELAIQGHLLARSMMAAVERRWGIDEAVAVGRQLFTGVGWIAAERLVPVLELDDSLDAVAAVLRTCHLTVLDDYLGLELSFDGDDPGDGGPDVRALVVGLRADAPALAEGDHRSLSALLASGAVEILESIAGGVNPRTRVDPVDPPAEEWCAAWRITIDEDGPARSAPDAVAMVRFTTGPTTVFLRRRPLRGPEPSTPGS
jgi:hypothetical protein